MTPSIEPSDDQIRTALHDAFPEGPPAPTTQLEQQIENRVHRRARRRVATRGAAVLTALTIVVAVIAIGSSREQDAGVVTAPPESTGFGAWGPGWHQFDTGPVPGSPDTATAWTGEELIVAAGRDTFAYNPTDRAWRALGALPFGDDRSPELVAAGNHVVAITTQEPDDQTPPEAATIDPHDATGWVEIDGPPLSPDMAAAWSITSVTSMRRPALVWTEQRVVDVGHGAVLDPDGWTWTPLPLPSDLGSFAPILGSNPVFDGSEVVLAAATSLPSLAWDARGAEFREIPGIPTEPPDAGGTPGWSSAVSPTPGTVVVATADLVGDPADSMVWNLDTSTNTWTQLPKLAAMGPVIGCPNNAADVSGRVLLAGCAGPEPEDSDIFELTGETWTGTSWSAVSPGTRPGWLGGATWQSTDDALVVWSNTGFGTASGGQSETDAWVWVPSEGDPAVTPPTTSVVRPSAARTPDEQALLDLGPGWHPLDTGPVPASDQTSTAWTGSDLVVAAGIDTFAYRPETRSWRPLGTLPFEEWEHAALVSTDTGVLAVGQGLGSSAEAAYLDPATDHWIETDAVEVTPALQQLGSNVPHATRWGGVALLWTGERVLDLTHGAVLDPATWQWSPLALPDDVLRFAGSVQTTPVWTGTDVVLASAGRAPGLAWNSTGDAVRETPGIPELLLPIPDTVEPATAISPERGAVVLIAGIDPADPTDTNSWRLDLDSSRWTALPRVPGMASMNGCPSVAAVVTGVPVVASCASVEVNALGSNGLWEPTDAPTAFGGWGTPWLATPAALVAWSSDTDTTNNPDAPDVEAWVWVPPTE